MSSSYIDFHKKIEEMKEKLGTCAARLEGITSDQKGKYENPQYRIWSGDIRNLEEFSVRLEEWLSQPSVSEAKRCLSDLRKWSEQTGEISVEEIEKDWRFLSDYVQKIKESHKKVEGIEYETIKKKTSTWILKRIIEKDIEHAKNWANNASTFAEDLKRIDNQKVRSKLAGTVKEDVVKKLSMASSFDKDKKDEIDQHQKLIDSAENTVENKPAEIEEEAILKTYRKGKEIEESLSAINQEVEKIKGFLINLEWVKEFTDFKGYNKLWDEKQKAIKKADLEGIAKALDITQQSANRWKDTRKEELDNALIRIERMSKSVEKENITKSITALEQKKQSIDWNKPNLETLSEIVSEIGELKKQLRGELVIRLQNEDAISIIEEPEIIEDLGRKKHWDFERFIKALEVVLRNGLIEIRAAEEK